MLTTLLIIMLSAARCAPGEARDACDCRQGKESACKALRKSNPKLAKELEKDQEKQARELKKAEEKQAREEAEAQKAKPTGQVHHIISNKIARELDKHPVLKGKYKGRDSRFVATAVDLPAHRGYQDWHRKVDDEVVEWLQRNPQATTKQFEKYLHDVYDRKDLKERFPHGF
ncbi:Wall-associated protein precursor [Myxococcus sp. K38C18041901]|uniref:Wall-associated protein precursor n=1 Tax=Myxococcus guangdongensis TaxID=2906760 RepID=UPI0020A734A8|nr:Wall-associated protein precursor [Myxococcus guangdongensis]MCP3063718.1 Wall-associated protein precursor [Myxococcus guangdongensis]